MIFFKQLLHWNELIFMLYLDRIYTNPFFYVPKSIFWCGKVTAIWKSVKVAERSQRWYSEMWRNDNWIETKRSNHEIQIYIFFGLLSSRIHWIKQQYKTKVIPKSRIPVLEIIFWFKEDSILWNHFRFVFFELSEKSGFWKTPIIHFIRGRWGGGEITLFWPNNRRGAI